MAKEYRQPMPHPSIWIGFDPRPTQVAAFAVTRHSIRKRLTQPLPVRALILSELRDAGLYTRPTEWRESAADAPILWDAISDAPMSTEFAISRFLVPHLAKSNWALFLDCDMLVRGNLVRLFDGLDRRYAVYCVKHNHDPASARKMGGQVQTRYVRKNWSSFMVFNCDHPANRQLTVEVVNRLPGRDLHGFCWLEDNEIGELGPEWNYLVGDSDCDPETVQVAHFTNGLPNVGGYEECEFADEWRQSVNDWACGALSLPG